HTSLPHMCERVPQALLLCPSTGPHPASSPEVSAKRRTGNHPVAYTTTQLDKDNGCARYYLAVSPSCPRHLVRSRLASGSSTDVEDLASLPVVRLRLRSLDTPS